MRRSKSGGRGGIEVGRCVEWVEAVEGETLLRLG